MSDAIQERNWWDRTVVDGTWRDNTEGVPPYDVDAVADRIVATLGIHGPLLDLGCGTGRLTRAVCKRITDFIVAVDSSPELLKLAIEADPEGKWIDYVHNDGRALPAICSQHLFRGAYAVTVLQHIPFEAQVNYLKQVWSILATGGKFTFTVAVGEQDSFLNHQWWDLDAIGRMLTDRWWASCVILEHNDPNGWTWVTLTR